MRYMLIGSRAAKHWFPDWREPKDTDAFTDSVVEGVETFWHPELVNWVPEGEWIASPRWLYTLKLSHSAWDLHNGSWEKHIQDAMELKKGLVRKGSVPLAIPDLYSTLYTIWEEQHGKKVVNLTQDKDAFFSDAVKRIYDHDSIHFSVAYGEVPIYERFLYDDAGGVKMDMKKVWASDFDTQIQMFREEIYATALERWIIPSNYKFSPRRAYALALKKTITSLTKGKSSLFLCQNYDVLRSPDMDYVNHHKSKSHFLERIG